MTIKSDGWFRTESSKLLLYLCHVASDSEFIRFINYFSLYSFVESRSIFLITRPESYDAFMQMIGFLICERLWRKGKE